MLGLDSGVAADELQRRRRLLQKGTEKAKTPLARVAGFGYNPPTLCQLGFRPFLVSVCPPSRSLSQGAPMEPTAEATTELVHQYEGMIRARVWRLFERAGKQPPKEVLEEIVQDVYC